MEHKKHTVLCADCLDSFKREREREREKEKKKKSHLTFFPRAAGETLSEAELLIQTRM